MLNETDAKIFKTQSKYPQAFVVGQDIYDAIYNAIRPLKQMDHYNLVKSIIDQANDLDEAYQMLIGNGAPQAATIEAPKRYRESDFKSRQELNSFLRRNGYTWYKIATMNEYEEDRYGECGRWQLFSSDDRAVTVEEALKEIG